MPTQTLTTRWATLTKTPTEPKPSKINPEWAPQHMVQVAFDDGTTEYIYFNEGPFSALQQGDTVLLEATTKGRWKLASTQTPELKAILEARVAPSASPLPHTPPPQNNKTLAPYHEPAPTPPATPATAPTYREKLHALANEYRQCMAAAAWVLKEEWTGREDYPYEAQKEIATTLFIEMNRRR